MNKLFFLVLIFIVPTSLYAEDTTSRNFCLNEQSAIKNDNFARKYPQDEKVIMLVALRTGLCDLVVKEIIELDFAIDLFKQMKISTLVERSKEDIKDKKNKDLYDYWLRF